MKHTPLNILDEYARRLSDTQVKMLLEKKQSLNEVFVEEPVEEPIEADDVFVLNIDTYAIGLYTQMNPTEFVTYLDTEFPSLSNVECCVSQEEVKFIASTRDDYAAVLQALMKCGFGDNFLRPLCDKNY